MHSALQDICDILHVCMNEVWSHQLNISFYEVARQIASPILHSTVQTNISHKSLDADPSHQDYINLFQTCEAEHPQGGKAVRSWQSISRLRGPQHVQRGFRG